MGMKTITIYDIAKEAGVSPATVSRVLTGSARVSEQKRDKIEDLVRQYDFRPNSLAQSLLKNESKTIGLILPDIINPFFATLYYELEICALRMGYTILLGNSMSKADIESSLLRLFTQKQADAFIFMGGRVNKVNIPAQEYSELFRVSRNIPLFMANGNEDMAWDNCYNIVTDEHRGIVLLTEYLISLGHHDISLAGGSASVTSSALKRGAFREVMEKHGLPVKKEWIISTDFDDSGGDMAMRKLLKGKSMPTAIIGINDSVAAGLLRQAQIHHIRVPEDVSVAGFDGSYLSTLVYPPLTTVSQNYEEFGKAIIDSIIALKNGEKAEHLTRIPTKLIIRDSCRPLK